MGGEKSGLARKGGEMGDMIAEMNGVKEGFAAFDKAVELDPDNFDAHFYYLLFNYFLLTIY